MYVFHRRTYCPSKRPRDWYFSQIGIPMLQSYAYAGVSPEYVVE
ncbi:hypothetical protein OROGR_009226 [Orobanche gracilis]